MSEFRIDPLASKQTVTINFAASSHVDYAHVLAAARTLRQHSSCYHRYGSTIEFYIPNQDVERFVNTAQNDGLDVII